MDEMGLRVLRVVLVWLALSVPLGLLVAQGLRERPDHPVRLGSLVWLGLAVLWVAMVIGVLLASLV
jgi:ABC-type dipeptide/oligopeptide/nickel transport system permease component